jgi:ribosomal protein RSM22 (predicted rRNA methylase)
MHIPPELASQIDRLAQHIPLTELAKYSQELSHSYRKEKILSLSAKQKLAYLYVRLPATYAAIVQVLTEALKRLPSLSLSSMGDIGAGPGTGLWAATQLFSSLKEVTLYERDPHFIDLGKQLLTDISIIKNWINTDVARNPSIQPHDLILASYSLGEIPTSAREVLVKHLWEATKKILVVIEPGTPTGFQTILTIRKHLIDLGAHIIAPCPHAHMCPMGGSDWCHFPARVERSSFHRQIKGGTLNFEDEKFSYLVVAREAVQIIKGRIIRSPEKHSGFVSAQVCTDTGIQKMTISRQSKDNYRLIRKAKWGDPIN